MKGTRIINSIQIRMNDKDARDIIEAVNMAENEGIGNRASDLKTILEALLRNEQVKYG